MSSTDTTTKPGIAPEALAALPVFPLPATVLLPHNNLPLHVFEPRYRQMLDSVVDGHRLLAVALLDTTQDADMFGRPRFFGTAGIGHVTRSIRMPDGRYNVVIEGFMRADISDELDPTPSISYRRVQARPIEDIEPTDQDELRVALVGFRSLCSRLIGQLAGGDSEMLQQLNAIDEPSRLIDLVAAAVVPDVFDRQRVLETCDVLERLNAVSGAIGEVVLRADAGGETTRPSWGIGTGEA